MSKSKPPTIPFDVVLSSILAVLGASSFLTLVILFTGTPDIADGIICRLANTPTIEKCDQFLRSPTASTFTTETTQTVTRSQPLMQSFVPVPSVIPSPPTSRTQ